MGLVRMREDGRVIRWLSAHQARAAVVAAVQRDAPQRRAGALTHRLLARRGPAPWSPEEAALLLDQLRQLIKRRHVMGMRRTKSDCAIEERPLHIIEQLRQPRGKPG